MSILEAMLVRGRSFMLGGVAIVNWSIAVLSC